MQYKQKDKSDSLLSNVLVGEKMSFGKVTQETVKQLNDDFYKRHSFFILNSQNQGKPTCVGIITEEFDSLSVENNESNTTAWDMAKLVIKSHLLNIRKDLICTKDSDLILSTEDGIIISSNESILPGIKYNVRFEIKDTVTRDKILEMQKRVAQFRMCSENLEDTRKEDEFDLLKEEEENEEDDESYDNDDDDNDFIHDSEEEEEEEEDFVEENSRKRKIKDVLNADKSRNVKDNTSKFTENYKNTDIKDTRPKLKKKKN